ncbi:MAG: protein kinase [candidate division Zixibacteria bacterium]|nr:protein kinase [candidate division Zixibacteria bacterium]
MMFQAGQDIAHFRIVRKLGEGGMGEVYLAEDRKLNRNVALKILQEEFVDDADRMSRFSREAKTAAKISHPNVMAIYDMDSAHHKESGRDLTYIVMEHISGQSLTDHLATRSPDMTELLRIAEKIAAGLAAAHKLGIVHRDIKSDNIMIDEQGEPRILDFGLAKPVDAGLFGGDGGTNTMSGELTQEGKILGTVSYMSPEQARGEAVDARSDCFSFGILLYRMFAGQPAFDGPDRVSTLAKILEGRHVPLRQRNETAPAELERIVDKCLHKDPNDRYQDTRDLVVDLRSLRRQYDSGISETSSVSSEILLAGKRRRRFTITAPRLIGAVAVLLILIATVAFFSGTREKTAEDDPLAFVENLGERITRTLAEQGIDVGDKYFEIPGFSRAVNGLAILGFQNKTGDAALDWLSAGLPEILLTDLAQSGAVNLISRSRMLDCLNEVVDSAAGTLTHGEWVAAARKLGATTVLAGAYYKLGDRIRIDARLEDVASGQIILAEKVVGADPFILVDSLTQKIAQSLNVKELLAENRQVADITSSSPEAYRHYVVGLEKFDGRHWGDAIDQFEKAIAIDSTFALPYMRIGMAHIFQGHQQLGASYFAAAKRFEDRLPLREKNMLDIYADTWLNTKLDDAFVKLRTFVGNYPDDKEARTFYSLFLSQIVDDKPGSLAQLDTVLMLDPKSLMAHDLLANHFREEEEYEKAIEHAALIKRYHPASPTSYETLASLYQRLGKYAEAADECEELLRIDPGNSSALVLLTRVHILQRNFEEAEGSAERIKENHADDPFLMRTYFSTITNLANWQGKFNAALGYQIEGLEQARLTGDSAQVSSQCQRLANSLIDLDMLDSAAIFADESSRWASRFQTLSYPFLLVKLNPDNAPRARELFGEALAEFKSRVPSEFWEIGDVIEEVFDALCRADTSAMIAASERMIAMPNQRNTSSVLDLGELLVLTGQYARGREFLQELTSGPRQTSSARYYLRAVYYIGMAEEGLGNIPQATAKYREVLKYWGEPEIEIDIITDTRARLAKLTS